MRFSHVARRERKMRRHNHTKISFQLNLHESGNSMDLWYSSKVYIDDINALDHIWQVIIQKVLTFKNNQPHMHKGTEDFNLEMYPTNGIYASVASVECCPRRKIEARFSAEKKIGNTGLCRLLRWKIRRDQYDNIVNFIW